MSFWPKYALVGWYKGSVMMNTWKREATNLNDVEQFGDNCRYSTEEGWSARALHLMAVSLDLDESALLLRDILNDTRRVHLLDVGQEDSRRGPSEGRSGLSGLHVLRFQKFKVPCESPGVGRKVLVRRELGRVDEDGDDGEVVIC